MTTRGVHDPLIKYTPSLSCWGIHRSWTKWTKEKKKKKTGRLLGFSYLLETKKLYFCHVEKKGRLLIVSPLFPLGNKPTGPNMKADPGRSCSRADLHVSVLKNRNTTKRPYKLRAHILGRLNWLNLVLYLLIFFFNLRLCSLRVPALKHRYGCFCAPSFFLPNTQRWSSMSTFSSLTPLALPFTQKKPRL